ncbi:MAG: ribonuclease PH, partial [Blastocatellia bacterium]
MTFRRTDSRAADQIRQTRIIPNISPYAEGSALIEVGGTKVICTASVEDRLPQFLRGKGTGWVTAEYAMLPRATNIRTQRESQRPSGRTQEIQRLIGRG